MEKKLTVEVLMRDWQKARGPVNTARTNMTNIAPVNIICEELGMNYPDTLTQRRIEHFRNKLLERGLSKVTVARYLSVLRAGLNGLVNHINLGKMISELKREPTQIDCWTRDEIAKILDSSRILAQNANSWQFHVFLQFLFSTGCRRGEALALQVEDIDFERERIHIHRALTLDGELQNGTKWGGERWVPMSVSLYRHLHNYLAARCQGSVFPNLEQRAVSRKFDSLVRASEVRTLKMHCTRHTAISRALTAGMSLRKASEIFGVSQQTLEKHYAHYIEEEVNMDWAVLP